MIITYGVSQMGTIACLFRGIICGYERNSCATCTCAAQTNQNIRASPHKATAQCRYDVVGLAVGPFLQFIGIIEPNPNHDSCWLHN